MNNLPLILMAAATVRSVLVGLGMVVEAPVQPLFVNLLYD
jgi:hypothetical protein